MKNGTFGLDIGATSIKAVWLEQKKQGIFLNAAVKGVTPAKSMFSESELDQEEMAQSLAALIKTAKITAKEVCVALPESKVYTRVVEMPPISDSDLPTAMMWQVEQYIPVPSDTLKIDWQVVRRPAPSDKNQTMQVLLVGAPIALIERYQRIIELTGLNVVAIETEILAASRALVTPNVSPTTLIVHVGSVSTALAIVKNGSEIVFTYNVSTGSFAISRAIASDFGLTIQQAEEQKRMYGITKNVFGKDVGKATYPILSAMAEEIKKVIAYYSAKTSQEDRVMQVVLSGGTAKLPGLDVFFAEQCGVETVVGNPWKVLASQQVPKDILNDASEYSVAVGLNLKDV